MPSFEIIIGDKVIDITKDVKAAKSEKAIKNALKKALKKTMKGKK